ncbi:hypothetical protein, partial [Actinoallomurus acaciae]
MTGPYPTPASGRRRFGMAGVWMRAVAAVVAGGALTGVPAPARAAVQCAAPAKTVVPAEPWAQRAMA